MANPTTNFGWVMPTSTDLVTDLPADFAIFGQAVDTSMADLKGGTTGQILSKATNTDMDFTWTDMNPGDITGVTAGTGISGGGTSGTVTITNSMATEITAKGDLIVGTGSATFDNLAAGANGSTLVADSSTSTGLRYNANFAAGKNKLINGDFTINQRSFTTTSTSGTYGFDRWVMQKGGTDGTCTYTPQTFTAGTAPVAGYEATNFARLVTAAGTATNVFAFLAQRIEDVRTFANQTITVSFWAKAASGTPKIAVDLEQYFGTGGSSQVNTPAGAVTISTSWARYSVTVTVPTISGTTIGAGSYTGVLLWVSAGSNFNTRASSIGIQNGTFDVWGVQAEAGSVATAFQTATGTLQGELAACQRYYVRFTGSTYTTVGGGIAYNTSSAGMFANLPVSMRVKPSTLDYGGTVRITDQVTNYNGGTFTIDANSSSPTIVCVGYTHTSAALTQYRFYQYGAQNDATAYFGFSAEL